MTKNKKVKTNCLRLYRKKNGLSQEEVASLMGLKSAAPLSHYERNAKLPNLSNALKLEVILHTPVAFLFKELFEESKMEILKQEKIILTR